jgi:PIN domain nuclease of toxin-antitoxin system
MILLDTHALIWLDQGHKRVRPLAKESRQLYVSPATILELQMLVEIGRLKHGAAAFERLVADDRWLIDEPPALGWLQEAADLSWTRDPFDRLIMAHARHRGWKLATADRAMLDQLGPRERVEL